MKYSEMADDPNWVIVAEIGESSRENVRWQWMGAGDGPLNPDGTLDTPPWPEDVDHQGNTVPCA